MTNGMTPENCRTGPNRDRRPKRGQLRLRTDKEYSWSIQSPRGEHTHHGAVRRTKERNDKVIEEHTCIRTCTVHARETEKRRSGEKERSEARGENKWKGHRIGTRLTGRTRTAETVCQTVAATRVPSSRRVDIIGDRG
ncbi:unnamed protein product [Heterotrigona itama]|uniref:Uncharacterized protein n=1 Tax=Heterotrigona itama TaxID=395501 RepID=A0A6V7HFK4_9HYME|nr:unnamed protein product [Heterotrigona itama]